MSFNLKIRLSRWTSNSVKNLVRFPSEKIFVNDCRPLGSARFLVLNLGMIHVGMDGPGRPKSVRCIMSGEEKQPDAHLGNQHQGSRLSSRSPPSLRSPREYSFMATPVVLSSTITAASPTSDVGSSNGLPKTPFLCSTQLFTSLSSISQLKASVGGGRSRRAKQGLLVRAVLDHIPEQFRQENLKEGCELKVTFSIFNLSDRSKNVTFYHWLWLINFS